MSREPSRVLFKNFNREARDVIIPFVNPTHGINASVDGSSTPVDFYLRPADQTYYYLDSIRYVIEGDMTGVTKWEDLDTDKFFQQTLTNGIYFESKFQGEISAMFTITDIIDMFTLPRIKPIQVFNGPLIKRAFVWELSLNQLIALNHDRGDYIRICIQDDLTGFDILRASGSGNQINF